MLFQNDGRKVVTIFVSHENSNQPLHTITLRPGEEMSRVVSSTEMTISVRGGLEFSGEDKEFTCEDLKSMREKLEQALLKVRSGEAKEAIEEVISMLGY